MAVASAGRYANHLHVTADSTSLHNLYRPVALPDAQPTVSEHWKQYSHASKNMGICFQGLCGSGILEKSENLQWSGKARENQKWLKSNCEHWWRQEENKWKGYAWLANWSQVLAQRKFVIWLQKSGNLSWKSVGTVCFNYVANFIVIICFRYSWERSTIVDNGGCVWCLEI